MPQSLPTKKKTPQLPREKKRLYLPQPGFHFWPFLIIVLLPVLLILLYAIYPWFSVSIKTTNAIVQALMIIFIAASVFIIFAFIKFLYDLVKPYPNEFDKDKNILSITLLFILSVLLVATMIDLIQV